MPQWLKILLLAVGLLIAVTFLAELVRAARRRRQAAIAAAVQRPQGPARPGAWPSHRPARRWRTPARARPRRGLARGMLISSWPIMTGSS